MGIQSIVDQVDRQDLIILDEGDWHLFDNISEKGANLPKCTGIIGLTATTKSQNEAKEEAYLKQNNFIIVDSCIQDTTNDTPPTPIKLDDFL